MEKLIAELARLYLPPGAQFPQALARHLLGEENVPVRLENDDGQVRAIVIPFDKPTRGDEGAHWARLCEAANALQAEFDLPAPAVSIDGATGYRLWLSLETPAPAAQAQRFAALLRAAYFPDLAAGSDAP